MGFFGRVIVFVVDVAFFLGCGWLWGAGFDRFWPHRSFCDQKYKFLQPSLSSLDCRPRGLPVEGSCPVLFVSMPVPHSSAQTNHSPPSPRHVVACTTHGRRRCGARTRAQSRAVRPASTQLARAATKAKHRSNRPWMYAVFLRVQRRCVSDGSLFFALAGLCTPHT